jgi:predicted RNA binding protein YcfA (HicA-like mRNA interferase family)
MKRIELERWMRSHGAEAVPGRSRGGHDAWRHADTGAKSFVPRHREIGIGVARAICRQLGIPPISKR